MYARRPELKVKIKPADSALVIATTFSPECIPGIIYSTPVRSFFIKTNVAALAIDSQYTTFPLPPITTTKPGSADDADGETRHPTGRGSFGLVVDGRLKEKVSGNCDVDV